MKIGTCGLYCLQRQVMVYILQQFSSYYSDIFNSLETFISKSIMYAFMPLMCFSLILPGDVCCFCALLFSACTFAWYHTLEPLF